MGNAQLKSNQLQAQRKLERILKQPERRRLEEQFAAEHQADTAQALYAYVKALRRKAKNGLKAADVVGYTYLTKRLGPWPAIMTRVNRELEEEKTTV